MKNTISTGLALLALSWGSSNAASFDGSVPLLCASATVIECLPIAGCGQVAPEAIGAPQFMRLDFAGNRLTSTAADGTERSSAIERAETVDGKLILQGAEEGLEGVRDGLGWTMAIAGDSGRMVLTASGDDAAFAIFGACTTL